MMSNHDRLGDFERATLLALMRLGPNAYGVTVRQEIEKRIDREVSIGAVYTTLDRLEQKGMVSSWIGEPTKERGGRAKKHFKVEAKGQRALEVSIETAQKLWGHFVPAGA